MLGVYPKLIDQMSSGNTNVHIYWHAEKKTGNEKYPCRQEARTGLTQSRTKIIILALVMHHVRAPKKLALVANPVKPVIQKVIQQYRQQPMSVRFYIEGPKGKVLLNP